MASSWNGFIGHRRVTRYIERLRQGAQRLGHPFPHILFGGPSGVGKTALAEALATACGTSIHRFIGGPAVTAESIGRRAPEWSFSDIVFFDEVHALAAETQERLYRIIDAWEVPVVEQQKNNRWKITDVTTCPKVTLVLATDQPGLLLNALVKRMSEQVDLDYYPEDDLIEIARRIACQRKMLMSPQALRFLARRCGGLPRTLRDYLQSLNYFFPDFSGQFSKDEVREYMLEKGIDDYGCTPAMRRYLFLVAEHGQISLPNIARLLGTDEVAVRRTIEEYLLRMQWIAISPQGRVLTEAGHNIVWELQP